MREILIFCFNWKKSAAEAHRMLVEVYGDTLLQLINHVGNGFDVLRMEISTLKTSLALDSQKNSKTELEALLEEDQSQTQEELAESLRVTQQAISVRLKGMIQKQGNWVPYELKSRDVERRFFTCEQLIQRQ